MGTRSFAKFFTKFFVVALFAAVSLPWYGSVRAQSSQSSQTPLPAQSNVLKTKEKKQTLSFEDELVEGNTQKPELFYLFQKKNFNYKRLIRLRENFLPEMRKTAEEIQRVRGVN